MILAALAARGETLLYEAQLVDRGYENLVDVLSEFGGDITRESQVSGAKSQAGFA